VTDAIEAFSCKDKDVEFFLKNKALEFEKRDKSRTYIICEEETFLSGDVSILAYFTLSLKPLEFRDNLSKNKIKEVDGFSKEVESVAIALIGQFGKDEARAKEISGKDLLTICMKTTITSRWYGDYSPPRATISPRSRLAGTSIRR
jgi:hypothetical protein